MKIKSSYFEKQIWDKASIKASIYQGKSLSLVYNGSPMVVIPLVLGCLKNGRDALLCYKIDSFPDGLIQQSIRLIYIQKMSKIETTTLLVRHSRRVDHYFTRVFAKIYMQSRETDCEPSIVLKCITPEIYTYKPMP